MLSAPQVRRPLIGFALAAGAGWGVQRCLGSGSPLLLLGLAALVGAFSGRRPSTIATYLLCALLAAAQGALHDLPVPSRSVLQLAETEDGLQTVAGRVLDEPVLSEENGTVSFRLRATAARYKNVWYRTDTALRIYLNAPPVLPLPGEQWRLNGRLICFERPRGGAAGSLQADSRDAVRTAPARFLFSRRVPEFRQKAAGLLRPGAEHSPESVRLLQALLLGYQQSIPPELYRIFSRTGTLHIFAISGTHVGVMAAILIAVLKIFGVARPHWGRLLIPALGIYVAATGMKPSALRAFTMAAAGYAAVPVGRRPDAPSAVALAALLLLSIQPWLIGDPGFLLSFVVVSGLLLVQGWAERRYDSSAVPKALRGVAGLALTSLAAWLFSAPVTAWFFNTLSPSALAGNLAVIPLAFMIMLTGCLALLTGSFFISAAVLFNQANGLWTALLIWIVEALDRLPGSCLAVRAPSLATALLWYAGLVFLFCGVARRHRAAWLPLGLAILFWGAQHVPRRGALQLLREDRSSLAIRLPDSRWMLFTDGRPYSVARAVRRLQQEGVNRLELLTICGNRADANTVQQLRAQFRPHEVRVAVDDELLRCEVPGGTVSIRTNP
jgi:ComEC/Rec2-related protein